MQPFEFRSHSHWIIVIEDPSGLHSPICRTVPRVQVYELTDAYEVIAFSRLSFSPREGWEKQTIINAKA